MKVEHILSRRLFDRLYWSWYGAGATGVGWELWLLGFDQYVGSGAATTDDLERWRVTDEGKDYVKQATLAWGRGTLMHALDILGDPVRNPSVSNKWHGHFCRHEQMARREFAARVLWRHARPTCASSRGAVFVSTWDRRLRSKLRR